ncbi:MAG TPA: DUF1648 domain-containing protein [Blastocatellia bacterium]|nr:DUF1648 domain-containing protein [Blastocatellia bacterium]
MSDLSYLIGYVLLLLLNLQMLLSWRQNPVAHGEEAFFGLRVSREAFDGAGRLVLRQYRARLAVGFLLIEGLNLFLPIYVGRISWLVTLRGISNLLFPVFAIRLFGLFQEKAKGFELAEPGGRHAAVALMLKTRRLGDYTNTLLETASVVIFFATFLLLNYCYPLLPDRLPTHANWGGVIDGWRQKSFATVFGLPIWLFYLQAGVLLLKYAFVKSPRSLPAQQTEEHMRQAEEFLSLMTQWFDWARGVWLYVIVIGDVSVIDWYVERNRFAAAGMIRVSAVGVVINIILTLIFWILVAVPSLYFVRRLYLLDRRMRPAESGQPPGLTDYSHFLFGGLLYFNTDNPALFVKGARSYTINLANYWCYVIAAYLAGIGLLIAWAPELL